jgi:Uma2 family endonuclease
LPDTAFIEMAPDWVCEVPSPSTEQFDRTDKLAVYAAFGVGYGWYVDPLARTLEVLARQGDKWLIAAVFKDDDEVSAPPFEAHAFKLELLWSDAGA